MSQGTPKWVGGHIRITKNYHVTDQGGYSVIWNMCVPLVVSECAHVYQCSANFMSATRGMDIDEINITTATRTWVWCVVMLIWVILLIPWVGSSCIFIYIIQKGSPRGIPIHRLPQITAPTVGEYSWGMGFLSWCHKYLLCLRGHPSELVAIFVLPRITTSPIRVVTR